MLFFFKANPEACTTVSTVISKFCNISRQVLNLQKSFVKFSPNIPDAKQQEYKSILRMESKDSIGSHPGTPIDFQSTKVQHFTPLLEKISSRISSWNNNKLLSPQVKLIIINSILIASIAHQLGVFNIPNTIANKIDSLIAKLFCSSHQSSGIHWKKPNLIHQT